MTRDVGDRLGQRAATGIGWATLQRTGSQLITAGVLVLLARLLEPNEFGLVALAAVFVALVQLVVDQGFGQALVQRSELTPAHRDTAFWSSLALGVVLGAALSLLAGPIAAVMDEPALAPVLRVLSFALPLTALISTPQALLQRRLAFRSLAIRGLLAAAVSGAVAVGFAVLGFGVWSLVAQTLTQAAVGAIVLWIAARWRPGFELSWPAFCELFGFGAHLVGANLLNFTSRRSDDFLIGATLGTLALGFYSVAYRLLLLLTDVIMRTISSVAFPVFSRIQHDLHRMRRGYLTATQLSSTVATPIYIGMAVLAPELVRTVFGAKWDEAIPVMQILALIGVLQAATFMTTSVLLAAGKPRTVLAVTALNTVGNVIGFAIAVQWGIAAVAAAYVIRGYLLAPLWVVVTQRILEFQVRDYLARVVVPLACSAIMAAAMLLIGVGLRSALSDVLVLVALVPLGATIYGLSLLLVAPRFANELLSRLSTTVPALRRVLPTGKARRA